MAVGVTTTRTRRPPTKRRLIIHTLRREIIKGLYAPGVSLPARSLLTERFQTSAETLQAAMDQLAHDGFVVTRGRQGTFATDFPPHLYRYGLVFGGHPVTPSEPSPFWTALHQQVKRGDWADKRTEFTMYHCLDAGAQSPDYTRLIADVRSQRLAGLILTKAWPMRAWAEELEMPMVVFGSAAPGGTGETLTHPFHAIDLDMEAFRDRALADLARRGVRRVGFLVGKEDPDYFRNLQAAAAKRGMEVRGQWVQSIGLAQPHWAWHAVLGIMQGKAADRPEALVITDDLLLKPATAALRDLAVRVPKDLLVTAHANFPRTAPAPLRATRLGFRVHAALQTAMDLIQKLRQGLSLPAVTRVAPVFEHELEVAGATIATA